jgi:thioredoxin 1
MVVEITEESKFIELVADEKNGYVLVDFFAQWCGPCKQFSPTLERLSKEWPNVDFYKVDIENLTEVASQENIRSMPTFILYFNGIEVEKVIGASEKLLLKLLEKTKQD